MTRKVKSPNSQKSDSQNANKGTSGTNITWDKKHGNRGKQLNPNQSSPKG